VQEPSEAKLLSARMRRFSAHVTARRSCRTRRDFPMCLRERAYAVSPHNPRRSTSSSDMAPCTHSLIGVPCTVFFAREPVERSYG
jgi:hypothetical protein